MPSYYMLNFSFVCTNKFVKKCKYKFMLHRYFYEFKETLYALLKLKASCNIHFIVGLKEKFYKDIL